MNCSIKSSCSTDLSPAGGSVKWRPAVIVSVIRRDFILQQQFTHRHVSISSGYVQLHTQEHTQCWEMKYEEHRGLHVDVSHQTRALLVCQAQISSALQHLTQVSQHLALFSSATFIDPLLSDSWTQTHMNMTILQVRFFLCGFLFCECETRVLMINSNTFIKKEMSVLVKSNVWEDSLLMC